MISVTITYVDDTTDVIDMNHGETLELDGPQIKGEIKSIKVLENAFIQLGFNTGIIQPDSFRQTS